MTPSLPSSSDFLLPQSLQDLHHKTLEWESDIELWKRELTFFQKLINEYGNHFHRRDEVKECDHFKMLLDYYAGQLMSSLSSKMISHEVRLKALMRNATMQDESEYRNEHRELARLMSAYEKEFQCYKQELFQLIEKVLVRGKANGHTKPIENGKQTVNQHSAMPFS